VPRAHDDNWDLASSVGMTATMVAAGRALASNDPRGLIDDPFAEPLVRAVGVDFFTKMMDGELDLAAIETVSPLRMQAMTDGMAARTKDVPAPENDDPLGEIIFISGSFTG
jgi:O-methyltransferase involved in polyketide biosynthesis